MGQYINIGNGSLPTGTRSRGGGWADVDSGRGQYINIGKGSLPSGATSRGGGWAVTKTKWNL